MNKMILQDIIERRILMIRGEKIMLDRDLADLYGVTTSNLNKAVSRNIERFPEDFMFQLSNQEVRHLMFHFGTSRWGGTRRNPRVFTEQGVAMLSSILHSKQAIMVNIAIMRAFVKLRGLLSVNKELARKLDRLEKKIEKNDGDIQQIFEVIRQLMTPPKKSAYQIGFAVADKK